MRYDTNLKIRYVSTKELIYNTNKKSVSMFYLFRTMISWLRFDNRSYDYTLTIKRAKR